MTHDEATLRAREIASRVLAPAAGPNDKAGRFSTEAVDSLGQSGLLALMLPPDLGGPGLGPRTFAAVAATLAEADASVAMVYLMHILGVATIRSERQRRVHQRQEILGDECGLRQELYRLFPGPGRSRSHRLDSLPRPSGYARRVGRWRLGRFGTSGQRLSAACAGRLQSPVQFSANRRRR